MDKKYLKRTSLLIGDAAVLKLAESTVLLCGVGGVGGYVCEALVRTGVGKIIICDGDTVSETNLNRQLIALNSNIGMRKTEAAEMRVKAIDPNCETILISTFLTPDTVAEILETYKPDCVADAIDDVPVKVALAVECEKRNIKIVASMGAGNKLDPTAFVIDDIYKTKTCPLAKTMRKLLKENGVKSLRTVYSNEPSIPTENRQIGSVAYVPAAAGLAVASEVIKLLLNP